MCGAPNAAQNNACTRCGARLVPLTPGNLLEDAEPDSPQAQTEGPQAAPAVPDQPSPAEPFVEPEPTARPRFSEETASPLSRLFPRPERTSEEASEDESDWEVLTAVEPVDLAARLSHVLGEDAGAPAAESAGAQPTPESEMDAAPVDDQAADPPQSPDDDEIVPDWLRSPPEESAALADREDAEPVSLPGWLQDSEESVSTALGAGAAGWGKAEDEEWEAPDDSSQSEADTGIPSWLLPADAEPQPPPPAADAAPGPAMATLPDWLKSLQPEAATFADKVEEALQRAESTSGLLTGVPGALPVEPIIAIPHIVGQIQEIAVVEDARAGKLLTRLLTGRQPSERAVTAERRPFPWRAIGHLVLLLALIVPLLVDSTLFNIEQSPAPAQALYSTVEAIPEGSFVLIAFDYEADLAGEMEPQAEAIMRHLRSRNQRIGAISLFPQGPFLAQQAWNRVSHDQADAQYGQSFVNLGFLVGREVGLRTLAQGPLQLDRPDFVRGQTLQNFPALAGVKSLEDIPLIVLIGARPDAIRWWVEQVGSHDSQKPLVAAVPASVEPAVRPYYHSGQLRGLISGLMGAADYDLQTGRPPAGEAAIDALTLGSAAVLLLIAVSALFTLVTRRGGADEEA